ncbi:chemotaxis protein [Vibrio cionasavignyae]|uniref:chemotaxis protein n=1 Tax=Vibrio cionasavignyae TaxID=2910252 RepID=UPI003D0A9387
MGGSSSSKSSSNTTNVSGQNAISGDNLGTAISGVNNSTISVTATDYGAIDKSYEFAGQALDETMDFAGQALGESMGFAENALDEFSSANSENLQMLAGLSGSQAEQNTENISAMMELAKFNKDGGQSKLSQQQLILMAVVIVVIGLIAYKAVK